MTANFITLNANAETAIDDFNLETSAASVVKNAAPPAPVLRTWMHTDVKAAWDKGYKGQGTNVYVVDDFSSANKFSGNLIGANQTQRHGEWTSAEINAIAPSGNMTRVDFNTNNAVALSKTGLNVINASYGLYARSGYSVNQLGFGNLHGSLISAAKNGAAIVVKAAGNNSVAVNGSYAGNSDYLNLALIGAPTAIFVGALNSNGSVTSKAAIASYSNYAGNDIRVQNQFLMVGVEGNKTNLYGTSFAAPIISGYSQILGSKFTNANAAQITKQLLTTARTDTIQGYNPAIHGKGEASLSRALSPVSLK
ncbi:S8 family serine peptidase [Deefgea chitinilytica]|uniref:S8 family serine peptidase n=2 Tax=Chitinibacteraceae TaxID=2897177 RepID=A0ABS2C992_9NEIS|nr:S8 family serine peptidase [Deefgea chitinilytica]MBM9887951.1 S8 family serine peptidase [Deefgea sp. CFH1-16]